jgi:addiction module HigA family antidote
MEMTVTERLAPIHPGEILREEFMKPLKLSSTGLAMALRVPPQRIHELVSERRGISADTALRLSRFFDTTPTFWMGLQTVYELEVAERRKGREIATIQPRPGVPTMPAAD